MKVSILKNGVAIENGGGLYKIIYGPYEPYLLRVNISDSERHYSFAIHRDEQSAKYLDRLVHDGIPDNIRQVLSLIDEIKEEETQAKYFDWLASGTLDIRTLEKAVKLSNSNKYTTDFKKDFDKMIWGKFTHVCRNEDKKYYYTRDVYYLSVNKYQIIVTVGSWGGDETILLSNNGVLAPKEGKKRNYVLYALYSYLKNGREDLIKRNFDENHEKVKKFVDVLNNANKIYDEKLYNYLKSVLTMYLI